MSKNNGLMLTVFVTTPAKKHFRFMFLAIRAERAEDLLIEREFYLENGALPEFPHHELLLCKGGAYNGMSPDDMHLHKSKKEGDYSRSQFLCFTGRIADEDAVKKIVRVWCVGTTYRFETGEDMNTAIERLGGVDNFIADCEKTGYACHVY